MADTGAARREPHTEPDSERPGHRSRRKTVELNRVIHGRVRLGIMSALAVNDSQSFTDLRELLGTTDGNLSVHARKLEDAGYVECHKSFSDRVPKTEYSITEEGRAALDRYLSHMEALIDRVRGT